MDRTVRDNQFAQLQKKLNGLRDAQCISFLCEFLPAVSEDS